MKVKVNYPKERKVETMEENNILGALKVKDVVVKPKEEEVTTTENIEDPVVEESEDIGEDTVEEETVNIEEEPKTPEVVPEVVTPSKEETKDDGLNGFKRIAVARMTHYTGLTLFRFDMYYKEYAPNSGTIALKNTVNNFSELKTKNKKEVQELFAAYGIIHWNFPNSVIPVNNNVYASLNNVESLVNNQIYISGIKKGNYTFKIDFVE